MRNQDRPLSSLADRQITAPASSNVPHFGSATHFCFTFFTVSGLTSFGVMASTALSIIACSLANASSRFCLRVLCVQKCVCVSLLQTSILHAAGREKGGNRKQYAHHRVRGGEGKLGTVLRP